MYSWILFALLSSIFAALVAVFGKIGIQGVDTTIATAIRAIIMASFLIITSFALGKIKLLLAAFDGRAVIFIALSGLAGALSWLFYFYALKNGPATGVAALDRLSVVFVLIFAVLFLKEGLTWKSGVGAALLTLGALLMTLK